jgi:tetratricopeptide (TPR) repeat protein
VGWHLTGMVYHNAGQREAAEDAYRKSLAIRVQLGNVAGQAGTLGQLGNLYKDDLDRPEEAAAFYRQAMDKYVELGDKANEGRTRTNLGDALRKLRHFDEARHEVRSSIVCMEPLGHAGASWIAWHVLNLIESDDGNVTAAAAARRNAVTGYLAYRREGGENHYPHGRICFDITQALVAGDPVAATSLLQQISADAHLPVQLNSFVRALQRIVAGSRDRTLADIPGWDYTMAAEILILIETLEQRGL